MSTPTTAATTTLTVTVRYFAGAKAAAGTATEAVPVPVGAGVGDVLAVVAADHGDALARVLGASSFLLDGVAVHDRAAPVAHGVVLDVLPPFAGG